MRLASVNWWRLNRLYIELHKSTDPIIVNNHSFLTKYNLLDNTIRYILCFNTKSSSSELNKESYYVI